MTLDVVFVFAFAIGMVAGLRSMMAPAAVSWAAYTRGIDLSNSHLAFLGSAITAYVLAALALCELVADKLPSAPKRVKPGPFGVRILMGALCGAALYLSRNQPDFAGGVVGALGAVAGTFAGYCVRRSLVGISRAPDWSIALAEDLVAIGGAWFILAHV